MHFKPNNNQSVLLETSLRGLKTIKYMLFLPSRSKKGKCYTAFLRFAEFEVTALTFVTTNPTLPYVTLHHRYDSLHMCFLGLTKYSQNRE